MNRKVLLERVKNPDDRVVLAKVLDKIEIAEKAHTVELTGFLDPYQQSIITPVLDRAPGISFIWDGGFEAAERRRLVVFPEYMDDSEIDEEICFLEIKGNLKFQSLSHRDYLGSILGLGIKREKIGDLIIASEGCQVIVDRGIASYISANLTKVHKIGVKVREVEAGMLKLPEEEVREIFATVASLRLDAVAAAGFGVSRSKITAEIFGEKVRVNWSTAKDCSYGVSEGDMISIRGRGRVEIQTVKGETKKGRIALLLKKYS